MSIVVIALLTTWLLATIFKQLESDWSAWPRQHDIFALLPRWTFFAPNPGTSDYHLVIRIQTADGQMSPFYELPLPRRRVWAPLWNPDKRLKKAVLDLALLLKELARLYEGQSLVLTFPYIALLGIAQRGVEFSTARRFQFCLLETRGFDDDSLPDVLLSSDLHDVDEVAA